MNRKIKVISAMISLILCISLGFFTISTSAIDYILASLGRVDATAKYEFYSGYDDKSEDYFNIKIDNDLRLMTIWGRTCDTNNKYGRYIIRYTSDSKYRLIKDFEIADDGTYSLFIGINGLTDGEYFVTARLKPTADRLSESGAYQIRGIPFVSVNQQACFFPHSMVMDQNAQLRAEANYKPKRYLDKTGAEYKETGYGLSKSQVEYMQTISDWLTKDAKTDREKMLKIHNWVAGNIYYDDFAHKYGGAKTNPYYLAKSIADGYATKSVCNGYSSLVLILARCAKIPCRQVKGHAIYLPQQSWESEGKVLSEVDHFWNEAYVDGRWMTIDATRDTSSKYTEDGEWLKYDFIRYNYFDPSDESLAATHLTIGYKDPIILPEPTTTTEKAVEKKSSNTTKTTEKPTETTIITTTETTTQTTTQMMTSPTTIATTATTTIPMSSSGDALFVAPTSDAEDLTSTSSLQSSTIDSGKDDKKPISPQIFIVIGAVVLLTTASSLSIIFLKKKK